MSDQTPGYSPLEDFKLFQECAKRLEVFGSFNHEDFLTALDALVRERDELLEEVSVAINMIPDAVIVRPSGGPVNLRASLAVSVAKLVTEVKNRGDAIDSLVFTKGQQEAKIKKATPVIVAADGWAGPCSSRGERLRQEAILLAAMEQYDKE